MNNALSLCATCHFKAHAEPLEFAEFVKKHLGRRKYAMLRLKRHEIFNYDLEKIVKVLEKLNE